MTRPYPSLDVDKPSAQTQSVPSSLSVHKLDLGNSDIANVRLWRKLGEWLEGTLCKLGFREFAPGKFARQIYPANLPLLKHEYGDAYNEGGIGKAIWSSLREIHANEGWKGLYRGVGPNIAGNTSSWGLCFLLCTDMLQLCAVTAMMTNPIGNLIRSTTCPNTMKRDITMNDSDDETSEGHLWPDDGDDTMVNTSAGIKRPGSPLISNNRDDRPRDDVRFNLYSIWIQPFSRFRTIILTYVISQSALPMPGRIALFSPSADLTLASHTSIPHDTIPLSNYQAFTSQYLGNFPANHPLASGILILLMASWPETLVMTGTADSCAESSWIIVSRIQQAGGRAELVEYVDLTHMHWMVPQFFPQSDNGLERLAGFVYN
ncbi:hypothetical protein F4604DRAFT_1682376 [Suillus subluteus]|nr:hypothetical protein F4604DRAFT_1682376 [Suillus subluteus]